MHVTSPPAVSAGSTQSLFKCCSFSYPLAPAPSCCQARSNLSNKALLVGRLVGQWGKASMKRKHTLCTSPQHPTSPQQSRQHKQRTLGVAGEPAGGHRRREQEVPPHLPPLPRGPGPAGTSHPLPVPRGMGAPEAARPGYDRPRGRARAALGRGKRPGPPSYSVAASPGRLPKERSAWAAGRGRGVRLLPAGLRAAPPPGWLRLGWARGGATGGGKDSGHAAPGTGSSEAVTAGTARGLAVTRFRQERPRESPRRGPLLHAAPGSGTEVRPPRSPQPRRGRGHPRPPTPLRRPPPSRPAPTPGPPPAYPPPPGASRRCLPPFGAHPYLSALRLALHPGAHPSPGPGTLARVSDAHARGSSRAPVRTPVGGAAAFRAPVRAPAGSRASSRAARPGPTSAPCAPGLPWRQRARHSPRPWRPRLEPRRSEQRAEAGTRGRGREGGRSPRQGAQAPDWSAPARPRVQVSPPRALRSLNPFQAQGGPADTRLEAGERRPPQAHPCAHGKGAGCALDPVAPRRR